MVRDEQAAQTGLPSASLHHDKINPGGESRHGRTLARYRFPKESIPLRTQVLAHVDVTPRMGIKSALEST